MVGTEVTEVGGIGIGETLEEEDIEIGMIGRTGGRGEETEIGGGGEGRKNSTDAATITMVPVGG